MNLSVNQSVNRLVSLAAETGLIIISYHRLDQNLNL